MIVHDRRAMRILAQSLVRDLLAAGFDSRDLTRGRVVDEVADVADARPRDGQAAKRVVTMMRRLIGRGREELP